LFEFTNPAGAFPHSARPLVASVAAHGVAFLLLLSLGISSGISISHPIQQHVTLIAPVDFPVRAKEMPVPPKRMMPPHEFRAPPQVTAHLEIPAQMIVAPAIEVSKPILPEIPRVPVTVAVIKTTGFNEVKPAALAAPKLVVKTSGFQNSESLATRPARGPVSTAGAFDSSPSAEATPVRKTTAVARSSGFSEESAGSSNAAPRGSIQSGTFGDTTVEKGAAANQRAAPGQTSTAAATITPVEILSKPKPAYTDEARRKNIEGEVLLEMQFSAAGEARVMRVVRGIGHGLDETAMAAARGIRFHPATRDGGAVDSAAIVHILFQLAN
jgi:TonB family protein